MNFKNGKELLAICNEKDMTISEVMIKREIEATENTEKDILDRMNTA